ncbi:MULTISPECIES: cobyric acid synthase [Cryobacterium]|uniref:Lipid II isoglutaminyl synthase (glutamine-hydrolyzing) subunit GatD n=1 Tax=Cryobacterium breve TaxID=1259258 RepID=A0ABY2J0V0_9MICO|nr:MULTISPECIES: cobyric acid synthase [Cryobacterium]TFC96871.1 cobyric acid synthase [Cryobacterium sp. TmT3-12]TFC97333.1 cobyric acid synthase [Cryobacterium breve]
MTRPLTIVSLLPELLGTNGDAANARVLAQRSRWAGIEAEVIDVRSATDLPEYVDAVVIGSGSDSDLISARDILAPMTTNLREWTTAGVPILAVGTGWELLSWGIELADGTAIEGLGVVAGRATPMPERATDDIVVDSRHGRLVGFENHARNYVGAEASPLGQVRTGTGNGAGTEGLVMGTLIGTHLHGPVLARNPGLADHLLRSALVRTGQMYAPGVRTQAADDIAQAARNQVAVRLGLSAE